MSKQRRRRYDSEFKRRAVEFVLAGDKSVPQIATDLGIELSSLYRWKREYLAGHDEAPLTSQLRPQSWTRSSGVYVESWHQYGHRGTFLKKPRAFSPRQTTEIRIHESP